MKFARNSEPTLLCARRGYRREIVFDFRLQCKKLRIWSGWNTPAWVGRGALTFYYSGASAARRVAKRSTIIIEKGPHICIEIGTQANFFFMVNMASGMDHGCVRPTTTTTTSHNTAAIQLILGLHVTSSFSKIQTWRDTKVIIFITHERG